MGNSSRGHVAMISLLFHAHGDAVYYDSVILDIVEGFCEKYTYVYVFIVYGAQLCYNYDTSKIVNR